MPADTQREVINADGKPGCDSLEASVCQEGREQGMDYSPSASYFSMEMYNFLLFSAKSSLASILIFVVKVNTFVCSRENEFLDVIASVMHSACCSLGREVINGSSHSVCSRQALLLPLPRWATRTSLTPSQEESKCMSAPCQWEREQEGRRQRVVKEEQRERSRCNVNLKA